MSSFSAKSSPIKLGGLQALRAVAVILVVYFHVSTAVYDYHGAATDTLLYGLHRIGPAGVDIFFVISGFIMAYTRRDNAAGMRDARVFITRRIERVIPLYWLWTAVVLMLWIAGFIHKAHAFPGIKTIIASLLLWPLANTIEPFQPVLSQGWTLSFEAYFYVFFAAALMVRVPDRFMAAFLSLVFLAIFLVARSTTHDASVLYLTGSPLICEFIFGMVAAQIAKMTARMAIGTRLAYSALAAAVIGFFVMIYATSRGVSIDNYRVIIFGIPAFAIVLGVVIYDMAKPVTSKALLFLGDASYSIYLSHGFLTMLAAGLLKKGLLHTANADMLCSIGTIATVALSSVTYPLIEKPVLRLVKYRRLSSRLGTVSA
ncbi:acyltransferase [Paraburkholderia sediminicola]|jgi:exopolysaccharide production protein ExoZ|uniref:acyltransferase family protein n=1 Tax=Paraburkholderia TaxID=1822464 RepID=UPI0038B7A93C